MAILGQGKLRAEAAAGEGAAISPETIGLVLELAKEGAVIEDIEAQNQKGMDAGKAQEIQSQWLKSRDDSELVMIYRDKPSCRTMKDYFSKDVSIVDCYTLDAQGRVVGSLYQPHDFLQDQEPLFVYGLRQGDGKIYVNPLEPRLPASGGTVEISLPVVKGSKTVGVLVATVLPAK